MSPVSLIARKKLVYSGECYVSGETFEARDEADASLLTLVGLANRAEETTAPDPTPMPEPIFRLPQDAPDTQSAADDDEPVEDEPEPDEPSAEPLTTDAALVDAPRRRRGAYKRRDLKED